MRRFFTLLGVFLSAANLSADNFIRINQLGYIPNSSKVAVMLSQDGDRACSFRVVDIFTGVAEFQSDAVKVTGPLGQMKSTFRLDFSSLVKEGGYKIQAIDEGGRVIAESPEFAIGAGVYDGTADFVLNYMRQQRCGWNPFIKDYCHQKDGIITGHPTKDGQYLDVRGGWHDASDCLQYTTTSANAIYQMMTAYRLNPEAFSDAYKADGTPGANGIPDIVDEIKWGLEWLDKMNPAPGEMYNQIADDRDHVGMRLPSDDQADYGWGKGQDRPVYFCSGEKQVRGVKYKLMNATMGIASTAGKFASDFALGSEVLKPFYPEFAEKIGAKAAACYQAGLDKPGNCQTASVVSPYIYEEDNWVDDMELAALELYRKTGDEKYRIQAIEFGRREPVTPWMGADSARHYQWYPFMNMGHVELASMSSGRLHDEFIRNIRAGIRRTFEKAEGTPFLYGIPSVWCSNNLTSAMLSQCIFYRRMTGDRTYIEMEGALRDWLLGCNPWGVSMIVELPKGGTYPMQPHSFIINYKLGNTTGGLVDGPVYSTIFGSLLGVNIQGGTNYMEFQPGNMVYHDSTHDYSTNEPTMDGTASLTFPLSAYEKEGHEGRLDNDKNIYRDGGIVRTDPSKKRISLVFTADDRADGADAIISALGKAGVKGAFFFTGRFFELYPELVRRLIAEGHYVGSHSYGHLLYMPWDNKNIMNVSREEFISDMQKSYAELAKFGISRDDAPFFIPPYEHYNAKVSSWARQIGLRLVNYTPGTATNGDYTTPEMAHYYSSDYILKKIRECEKKDPDGLNGHIILIHLGTEPARTDKFYNKLPSLIKELRRKGYEITPLKEAIGRYTLSAK